MESEEKLLYYVYEQWRIIDPRSGQIYLQLRLRYQSGSFRKFEEAKDRLYAMDSRGTVVAFNQGIKAPDIIDCEIAKDKQ